MELEKAVELLQGKTFDVAEMFWSELGGDVPAQYTIVKVIDPEALLRDMNIDLSEVTDEDDLLFEMDLFPLDELH